LASKPIFDDVPEWPTQASAPAPRDHNKPPLEEIIPLEFRELLLAERADFLTRLDQFLGAGDPNSEDYTPGAVDRAKAEDEKTYALCGDLVDALRKSEQHVDRTHKAVKQPYLDGGRLVDAEKNTLVGRIKAGRDRVQALMDKFAADQREKQRKMEAEQVAERARLEELARENDLEAALPPPPPPLKAEPVRSDAGSTISTKVEHACRVEDYAKAFRKVKDDAKVREAIDAAIKRIVKATKGQPIPGVRIWETTKASVR
jgi:hypothetical protein